MDGWMDGWMKMLAHLGQVQHEVLRVEAGLHACSHTMITSNKRKEEKTRRKLQ